MELPAPPPDPEDSQMPLETEQTEQSPSEQEQLQAEMAQTIEHLNRLNVESLTSGNSRIGFRLGDGENETFVLAEPVSIDTPDYATHEAYRENVYVIFTHGGLRELRFRKGSVAEDGTFIGMDRVNPGIPVDSHFQDSEVAFTHELRRHAEEWEDKDGNRKATALIDRGQPEGKTPIEYRLYEGWEHTGVRAERNGRETLRLGDHRWDNQVRSVSYISPEIDETIVQDAMARSLEVAKQIREVPATPAGVQLSILRGLNLPDTMLRAA